MNGRVKTLVEDDRIYRNHEPQDFTKSSEDSFTTPGITTVLVSSEVAGFQGWHTLIVAGKMTSHLNQTLLSTVRVANRYYQGDAWSEWTVKALS